MAPAAARPAAWSLSLVSFASERPANVEPEMPIALRRDMLIAVTSNADSTSLWSRRLWTNLSTARVSPRLHSC